MMKNRFKMIDLHTHTLFSDGVLIPSEQIRRAVAVGYEAIAMTDHADYTNYEFIIESVRKAKIIEEDWNIRVLTGIEITHVPPSKIDDLARLAKKKGADIVVVHGETPVEPVASGTNHAAVLSEYVDILAHPGFLTTEDALLARENDVYIEITARNGHNRTNGYVARQALEAGAKIVCNTDAHHPNDLVPVQTALEVLMGAGLTEKQAFDALRNSKEIVRCNTKE